MGKVFKKALRILILESLDERKGRRVVEQDFHGNFLVNVTCFFFFFLPFSPVSLAKLSSFWYGLKIFHLAQARLTIKTDDITSGRRNVIRTHGNLPRRRS